MLVLIALLSIATPSPSHAEVLWRTWKNPVPAPVKLVKNFYEVKKVRGTCSERICEGGDNYHCENVCHNENVMRNVCSSRYNCTPTFDGSAPSCDWENVCEPQWESEQVCGQECNWERVQNCQDVERACDKEQKTLVRSWKVLLTPKFDATQKPTKGKDEKFTLSLAGDERAPQLQIKVNKSPFKYEAFEPRFSSDGKSVEVDFRVKQ